MSLVADGHLGGFIAGGDPDTFDPVVWDQLVETFCPTSVLDVGCGEGHAMKWFLDKGIDAMGIEGSVKALRGSPVKDRIMIHDFTSGPYTPNRKFDMAWSCEFVEHVEERYIPNFMEAFKAAPVVAMTYSEPQWASGGHHHVNCQPQEYWNERFREAGYIFLKSYSDMLRSIATARWVKPTVSVYVKPERS